MGYFLLLAVENLYERFVAGVNEFLNFAFEALYFILSDTPRFLRGLKGLERVGAMRTERHFRLLGFVARDLRELFASFARKIGEGDGDSLVVG